MKKLIATVTVGLALSGMAGVGLSAGLASPAGAATPASVSAPTTTGPGTSARHPLRAWLRAHRKAVARNTVEISAKTIGITPKALVGALRSGESIAQVAQAHDVAVTTVVDALVRAGDTQVGHAVSNHKLTPARGAKIEAVLGRAAATIVNHVHGHKAG
jgi:hypothetical protein